MLGGISSALFYDCEFLEDGSTIDLISIGIYAEDGREYYAVSNEFDTRRVARHGWLMENVMTSIAHEQFIVYDFEGKPAVQDIFVTDPAARCRDQIKTGISYFLSEGLEGDPVIGSFQNKPELWAWCGAYDHVCLAQLWGPMIDMPRNLPFWTDDIRTLLRMAGIEPSDCPRQPEGLHNALSDARWNKVRYDFVMEKLSER